MGKGQSTDVIVDETADVIVSHAATVDMISAMQPKEIWIDVEVVRADGTREPIETIKGEVVL